MNTTDVLLSFPRRRESPFVPDPTGRRDPRLGGDDKSSGGAAQTSATPSCHCEERGARRSNLLVSRPRIAP